MPTSPSRDTTGTAVTDYKANTASCSAHPFGENHAGVVCLPAAALA